MIQDQRIERLNDEPVRQKGAYVLYWMQAAQRERYNHALEYAVRRANELGKPVLAAFCLVDDYPDANARHYHFMLQGLRQVRDALAERKIRLIVRKGRPADCIMELSKDASLLVVDASQLRAPRKWRNDVAMDVECPMLEVETNLIVPVQEASAKEEFSAGTFRPRITRKLKPYLRQLRRSKPKHSSMNIQLDGLAIDNVNEIVASLNVDASVKPVDTFEGGTRRAEHLFDGFLAHKLRYYAEKGNDPTEDCISHMSPYLHFGQISPLYIALKVINKGGPGKDEYLEQLIVRRELSHNFTFYNPHYDSYRCLPPWAQRTLDFHRRDKRHALYSTKELEAAETQDPYWNAAQKQMAVAGKMHNYMRMYWGKKILEWSRSPQEAFRTALYLNNKYELDGRDPNGFAGVAWCFGKHDRAWTERDVFGKVRYMNDSGLKRKFNIDRYVEQVEGLAQDG